MEHTTSRLANILGAIALTFNDRLVGETGLAKLGAPVDHVTAGAAVSLLRSMPGTPMARLAAYVGLSQSAAVRLVDRLEGAGLVVRKRERGQHHIRVFPTRKGVAAADRLHRARAQVLEGYVATLTARDQKELLRISEQVAGKLPDDQWHAMHVCRLCRCRSCGADEDCPVWESVRDRPPRRRA